MRPAQRCSSPALRGRKVRVKSLARSTVPTMSLTGISRMTARRAAGQAEFVQHVVVRQQFHGFTRDSRQHLLQGSVAMRLPKITHSR